MTSHTLSGLAQAAYFSNPCCCLPPPLRSAAGSSLLLTLSILVLKQELDERGKGPDAAAYAWHICTFALGLGALLTPSRVPPAEAASSGVSRRRKAHPGRTTGQRPID